MEAEEDKRGDWILESKSGSGGFGIVLVWHNIITDERIAIKRCRFHKISREQREQWINEVQIMLQLDHPNVVSSFRTPKEFLTEDDDNYPNSLPLLCMQYCSGGDLRQALNEPKNCCGLTEPEVLSIVSDLTSALGYLHNRRILHRDLKPENVVINFEKGTIVYKLIDLGYAKKLDQSSLAQTIVGTLQYLAPEFFMGFQYTKSVDYWSLGLITHEIITGLRPFLPDYPPGRWMEVVEKKDRKTICIPEMNQSRVTFFEENHIRQSIVNHGKIESLQIELASWLQCLLEWDSSSRGKNESGELTVFSELEKILCKKRVKVICMDKCYDRFDFVVTEETSIEDLRRAIQKRANISEPLILTSNGNKLLSFEPILRCPSSSSSSVAIYLYACDIKFDGSDVKHRITSYGLQIPESVKAALTSPKTEVDFKTKRKIYAHGYYLTRQEAQNNDNLVTGTRIFILYLLSQVKCMNSSSQGVSKMFERALAKFELFQESLRHDIEKYTEQAQRKQRITSAQIFDSWQHPDPDLHHQFNSVRDEINNYEVQIKNINATIRELQKSAFGVRASEQMKELCSKSLSLYENLKRCSSNNGRQPDSTAVDMARIIAICLKRRDENLKRHFTLFAELIENINAISRILPHLEICKQKLEFLMNAITKSQKKRQSDIWKLLKAALQQTSESASTASTPTTLGERGINGMLEENQILRTNMHEIMDCTVNRVKAIQQNMSKS